MSRFAQIILSVVALLLFSGGVQATLASDVWSPGVNDLLFVQGPVTLERKGDRP